MSSFDDYLDDIGLGDYDIPDLSDYDIPDLTDYDLSDYMPTATGSSSAYPTSSYGGDDDDADGDDDGFDISDWYDGPKSEDDSGSSFTGAGGAGAIGTDYSRQETSSSCVSEVAFKTTGPKVDLAFDVIFLVLFIAIAVFTVIRLLKSKQKGSLLGKWLLFPASLFFAILYLFIDMITLILSECVMMRYDKFQQAQTAVKWFDSISIYLLIVLILLPICLKLHQSGTKLAKLTFIVHSILLGFLFIFLLVALATYTRIQDALYRSGDSFDIDLVRGTRGVTMTYYVFLFLGALLAGANMFFALFRKSNLRRGVLFLSIPVLALSTLALTLVLMGGYADREYGDDDRSVGYIERSGDAVVFLTRLFYAISFLSALVIASSGETIYDNTLPPAAPMTQSTYPPQGPGPAPPAEQTHTPVPVPAPYAPANVA
ncbi:hypothetical protein BJY04DRAFT_220409 [Aspergillus karnatakaensis]|uniref:uncharacterized protein n=1 Tax=Aspergillus karnatakaensis TaxID=1810916 RepID=UPI003CCD2CA0